MPVQEQYETSTLRLWSPLQRQLAACGQVKASPQQWIGTIRNLQKKGVSAVELEWSGVLPMLGEDFEANKVFDELIALAAALDGKVPREPVEQTSRHARLFFNAILLMSMHHRFATRSCHARSSFRPLLS